jgi:hypothetical protein
MKRALLSLICVCMVFAFSCRIDNYNGNTNQNSNANQNASGNRNSSEGIAATDIKEVHIGVNFDRDTSTYKIVGPIPDPTCLSKSHKDKIRWCIVFACVGTGTATVTIDGFDDKKNDKRDPFDGDNSFTITLGPGVDCAKMTADLKPTVAPGEYYKFNIHATVNGTALTSIDPGVQIAD